MGLLRQLGGTFITWMFIVVILVLIILLPNIEYETAGWEVEQVFNPVWVDYGENIKNYFGAVIQGDLGKSRFDLTVEEEISRYFPRSLKVIVTALLISIPLGILKGIYDYRNRETKLNITGNGSTWFMQSLPDFFIVMVVQYILIRLMRIGLPTFSIYGHDQWYSFILPAILLSIFPLAYIARVTSSLIASQEELQYVKTAIAKGLTERVVLYKHILANCWSGILSHLSSLMIFILSNLLIIEYLMFYKGAAYRLYEALGFPDARAAHWAQTRVYETDLAIALLFCFMLLVLIAQLVSQAIKHITNVGGGES